VTAAAATAAAAADGSSGGGGGPAGGMAVAGPSPGEPQLLPWFAKARAAGFKLHPLKYPDSFLPGGNKVCRPFNYRRDRGCLRLEDCGFDHQHCHHCLALGHIALDCPVGL
jgi:hypothetical protein